MKVITLEKCKVCVDYLGIEKTSVKCGRIKDCTGMIPYMPSNDNPGIKNGTIAVRCLKED